MFRKGAKRRRNHTTILSHLPEIIKMKKGGRVVAFFEGELLMLGIAEQLKGAGRLVAALEKFQVDVFQKLSEAATQRIGTARFVGVRTEPVVLVEVFGV